MYRKRFIAVGSVLGAAGVAYVTSSDVRESIVGIERFGRAAFTVARIAWDYNRTLYSKTYDVTTQEYKDIRSGAHQRSADRLLQLCLANGGVFVKVGQHVGALDYILPPEYVKTMKVLHNKVPPINFDDILEVVRQDLGKEPSEVFAEIDQTPLGTASLAQVHKAKLKCGETVALKVQHPLVKAHAQVDIRTMEFLVRTVAWVFPDFQFLWLAEETRKNLPRELDFRIEAENSERIAKQFAHFAWFSVPKVHWDYTTSRVLTMNYCGGSHIDDVQYMDEEKIDKRQVAARVSQLYSEMIFVHGYVHCDPHPGNVKVEKTDKGFKIHLLDHGLYTQLNSDFRELYSQLWLSIIRADVQAIQKVSVALGVGELYGLFACMLTARSWTAIQQGIDKEQFTSEEQEEIKMNAAQYLVQVADVLNRVPREMLLVFKTNDLLRSLDNILGNSDRMTSFITMTKCCLRAQYMKKAELCTNWLCRLSARMQYSVAQCGIFFYQVYLWGLHCKRVLCPTWMHL
nr:EOG090X047B [Triops cancriformis]